jgi:hypothetical protein
MRAVQDVVPIVASSESQTGVPSITSNAKQVSVVSLCSLLMKQSSDSLTSGCNSNESSVAVTLATCITQLFSFGN